MKRLLTVAALLFTTHCAEVKVNYDINRSLIVLNNSDSVCAKDVVFESYDSDVLKTKHFSILALSRTFERSFSKEDLAKKARELNACRVIMTMTTSCAERDVFGDFQGCWAYDMIYFVK